MFGRAESALPSALDLLFGISPQRGFLVDLSVGFAATGYRKLIVAGGSQCEGEGWWGVYSDESSFLGRHLSLDDGGQEHHSSSSPPP